MVSIGRSIRYSLVDLAYLSGSPRSTVYKLRASLAYGRLTLQFALVKLLRLRPSTSRILGLRFFYGDFPTFAFFFREVFVKQEYYVQSRKRAPIIFDCGANIGMATLYLKTLYPKATVHCFEPLPTNFRILRRNVEENRLRNVTAHQAAVSDKAGTLSFYFDERYTTGGRSSVIAQRAGTSETRVKAIRLSAFVQRLRPDIVKMDIEGSETAVLRDLDRAGALRLIPQLMIEYHHNTEPPESLAEFLAILERNGFRYYLDAALSPRRGDQDLMIYAAR